MSQSSRRALLLMRNEESGTFNPGSPAALAFKNASLRRALSTAHHKREDLWERLGQEKDIVAAQAADLGKWQALYEETEAERQKQKDEAELATKAAHFWYERAKTLEAENQRLREDLSGGQTRYWALELALKRAEDAQAGERAAVEALVREQECRLRVAESAAKRSLELFRVRQELESSKAATARDQKAAVEPVAEGAARLGPRHPLRHGIGSEPEKTRDQLAGVLAAKPREAQGLPSDHKVVRPSHDEQRHPSDGEHEYDMTYCVSSSGSSSATVPESNEPEDDVLRVAALG